MAVLNATPDSFYDGGKYLEQEAAHRHIDSLLAEGADIIDIGAESTRPGSVEVPAAEQMDRALPKVEYAVAQGACVSIDTASPEVARAALALGARIVNDVSCGSNQALFQVVSEARADLILMHSRGTMRGVSNYDAKSYGDIVKDIRAEWTHVQTRAATTGISTDQIWFDPGLGFHKNAEQSSEIMRRLGEFSGLGAGLVLGASRKSFIGALDSSPPDLRLGGSIAACLLAIQKGASIVRVHDVQASVQAAIAQVTWSATVGPQGAHA